jgi:hypothetical protein
VASTPTSNVSHIRIATRLCATPNDAWPWVRRGAGSQSPKRPAPEAIFQSCVVPGNDGTFVVVVDRPRRNVMGTDANGDRPKAPSAKLPLLEQVICAWPMSLIIVGGAIGGACGGAAWALNTSIMKSNRATWLKYLLIVLSGLAAGGLYVAAVAAIAIAFPGLIPRH